MITNFSAMQVDALREVVNISVSKAANALADLVGHNIMISVPSLRLVSIREAPGKVGDPSSHVVGMYFRILGGFSGRILLVIPQESAARLVDSMNNLPQGTTKDLSPIDKSGLQEIGNILTTSFLNALSYILDKVLMPTVPYFTSDLLASVMDFVLIEISQNSDYAFIMDTTFSSTEGTLQGSFLVFPETTALETLLEKLGLGKE